jgi:hypothetical protein
MMIFLFLHANIMICGSCVILALPLYGLLSAMLIYDLGVIDNIENKLVSRITIYTVILILN